MELTPHQHSDLVNSPKPLATQLQSETSSAFPSTEDDDNLPIVDAKQGLGNPELGTTTSSPTTSTIVGLAALDLSQTFSLSSLVSANQTIYLDFDGHTTTGTAWNNSTRPEIITPAYDFDSNTAAFSNAELERIQYIWQRVAEDFSPFNVNVTTKAPTDIDDLIKSGSSDSRWGIRVVIGGSSSDWFGSGAGGVAYMNSFNWSTDTPTFVFENQLGNGDEKYTTEAISHEVGHTLGLNHDGQINPQTGYYSGQGSGETGWGTIMGVGYYKNLSQWSKGEYTSASNTEDDLQIITTKNGFGYRADDAGDTIGTANALSITGMAVSGSGIIERNTDVDFYSFVAGAGAIDLNINPFNRGPNLDILAELYSANGTLIASSNPTNLLSANISTTLTTAGSYYLKIDGVGAGDPLVTGYSDYGSLGQYFINGNIVRSDIPGLSLAVSPETVLEDGTTNLVYTFSRTGDISKALTVSYSVAGTATLDTDYTQSGADSFSSTAGSITFAAGSNTAILTIAPKADTEIEGNETVALTLATDPSYILVTPTAVTGTITNDDLPAIGLALSSTSVQEDGSTNLVYTFTRTGDITAAFTVKYHVAGTATLDSDYTQSGAASFSSTAGTITFAAGANTATLTLDPSADNTIESNETVALTLVADPSYTVATPAAAIGTITNDDTPTITLALTAKSVAEDGATNLVYTFTRIGNTANDLTVNYQVGGMAALDSDYTQSGAASFSSTAGTITFAAGANTATLTLDPSADNTIESNETIALTLVRNSNYNLGTSTAVIGAITNDDTPTITLALTAKSVAEDGTTNLVYTFTRIGNTANDLTVKYNVAGTATLDTDYTQSGAASFSSTAGTISFAAGANTATLTLDPSADVSTESNETVALTLVKDANYNLGTFGAVTGTMINDDIPAITLALSPDRVTEDGTNNLVYTFSRAGDITNALTVNYQVGGTAKLADNDYTQTGADSFTSTAGKITFAAGSSTAILTIDPNADTTIESHETVAVRLTGAGSNYSIATTTAVVGTILDDDKPFISLELAAQSVAEDGTDHLVYTFTRSGNTTNAFSVNYKVGGTAKLANNDYTQTGADTFTSTAGTITFAAGANTATLTIDPNADTALEVDETVALTLVANNNYLISTPTAVTGTITDDDVPVISLALSPDRVAEDETTNLVYTFTRTANTTNPLTVYYQVGGTATVNDDYTQSGQRSFTGTSGQITFAAGSNTAQLTIDPKADMTIESDETVMLSLIRGTGYKLGTTTTITGTITNDELSAAASVPQTQNNLALSSAAISTTDPGLSLDLSQMVLPTTRVAFSVEREAEYNNSVGFYQALDAEGAIQTDRGILKPTDAGYIQSALQNALTHALESGLNLGAKNHGKAAIDVNLGKAFYLPILVANGTIAAAASGQTLNAYTAFIGANADRTEHIRLLGDRTFGFEDTFGGGDRDYNDLMIKVAIG